MKNERVYKLVFGGVYPHYLKKTETKGRTKAELDTIICWLTGYTQKQLQQQIDKKVDMETFFAEAKLNPNASKITGVICGYRVFPAPLTSPVYADLFTGVALRTGLPYSNLPFGNLPLGKLAFDHYI